MWFMPYLEDIRWDRIYFEGKTHTQKNAFQQATQPNDRICEADEMDNEKEIEAWATEKRWNFE